MSRLVTEWVNVTDDISIIARESGEVWFHSLSGAKEDADPFATPMTAAGAPGSTIGLLDGAINLGFAGIEKRLARPAPSRIGYIVALVGAYHTSVDTPRNLRRAALRFEESAGPKSRLTWKSARARRPATTGLRSRICVRSACPPSVWSPTSFRKASSRSASASMSSASKIIRSARSAIRTALERIAALKQESDIEKVKAVCPPGVDATRFLRSHSCLGSEVAHVEETISFVASLPAKDRITVVQETYKSALVMAEGYNNELLKSDAEMLGEIEQAIGETLPDLVSPFPSRSEDCSARAVA